MAVLDQNALDDLLLKIAARLDIPDHLYENAVNIARTSAGVHTGPGFRPE